MINNIAESDQKEPDLIVVTREQDALLQVAAAVTAATQPPWAVSTCAAALMRFAQILVDRHPCVEEATIEIPGPDVPDLAPGLAAFLIISVGDVRYTLTHSFNGRAA